MNTIEQMLSDLKQLRERLFEMEGETQDDNDSLNMATEYLELAIDEVERATTI